METILGFVETYGLLSYFLFFAYCALKSGSLPIFAGYAAYAGALDIKIVAAVIFAGGYLGDEARFYVVRRFGIKSLVRRPKLKKLLDTARLLFERFGVAYVFLYRYPKGMRTVGALPLGLTDIQWKKFTILNAASAALWTTLLVGGGYLFGTSIEKLVDSGYGIWSVALLVIFLIGLFFAWRYALRMALKGTAELGTST